MKILAFVDIHGNKAAVQRLSKLAEKADLLICAGDLTNFGADLNNLLKILDKANITTLIIHGNHETAQQINKASKNFKNIKFIHNKLIIINNYSFFGYGGGGFEQKDKALEDQIKKIKNKISVFVTHQPPYSTKLDKINNHHAGSKSIAKFIKELNPRFNICGHLHENINKKDRINKTFIVNPGFGKIINI